MLHAVRTVSTAVIFSEAVSSQTRQSLSNRPSNDVHMACSGVTSCELAARQGYNVLFVGVYHNLTTSVQAKDLIDGSGYLKEVGRTEEGAFHLIEQICTCWCSDNFLEL